LARVEDCRLLQDLDRLGPLTIVEIEQAEGGEKTGILRVGLSGFFE